ncbi:MAG: protein kinase [Polyangiaceae bacterium]
MTDPVTEGDVLDGKYRIDKILGQGGMGMVVAATNTRLNQKVAIKFLLPEALEHPDIVARFGREGEVAAKLQGQHVVRIIDVHEMPDGRPYIVMEHLSGEDLEHALDRLGCLPPDEAVHYLLQACEALAEAHSKGIIHRDLKPANLFLAKQPDRRSIVKILDFGISKVTGDAKNLTRTATAMGTPFYMSPEQLMNAKDVDARSDIWALGVIFFELLTGVRPFEGSSMPEIVAHILRNERPTMRELRSSLPDICDDIATKCLQNDRNLRYATVEELANSLALVSGDEDTFAESTARIGRLLGRASLAPGETMLNGGPPTVGRRGHVKQASGPPTAIQGAVDLEEASSQPQSAQLRVQESAKPDTGTQLAMGGAIPRAAPLPQIEVAGPPAEAFTQTPAAKAPNKLLLPLAIGAVLVVGLGGGIAYLKANAAPADPPKLVASASASITAEKDPPPLALTNGTASAQGTSSAAPTTPSAPPTGVGAPSASAKLPTVHGSARPLPTGRPTGTPVATAAATSSNPLDMKVK